MVETRQRSTWWRDILIYMGLWTVMGLLDATQQLASATFYKLPFDPKVVYVTQLLNFWTCGVGTPIYLWLVRRFPLIPWDVSKLPWLLLYAASMFLSFILKFIVWIPIQNAFLGGHMTLPSVLATSLTQDFFGIELDQFYFLVLLYAVENYRWARARELQASQLRAELSQAQLDALRSQLHPHFLFNTLNSIATLMRTDVEAAEEMLSRLSDMLRLTLQAQTRQEVKLRDEVAALDLYLKIMAVRFGDRLSTKVLVDEPLYDERVPTFLLQPIVENAIRHGIDESLTMTHVDVIATADERTLTLRVLDDGKGLPPKEEVREGIGLRNTRRRLEEMYGDAGKISIEPRVSGGTEVVVQIPRRSIAWA